MNPHGYKTASREANITFDRTAGSRSLAAAGQRERGADRRDDPWLIKLPSAAAMQVIG
jgi:hypothetical protein